MSAKWIDASAVLSTTHATEFEALFEEALEPGDATVIPYPFLRVRLRDVGDEVVMLMALSRCGQHHRVGPLTYAFPAEWEEEVREILAFHSIKAGVVPSVCYRIELRDECLLDDLHAALLGRAATFRPTYPRIAVSQCNRTTQPRPGSSDASLADDPLHAPDDAASGSPDCPPDPRLDVEVARPNPAGPPGRDLHADVARACTVDRMMLMIPPVT